MVRTRQCGREGKEGEWGKNKCKEKAEREER